MSEKKLTPAQKARVEVNRLKALERKRAVETKRADENLKKRRIGENEEIVLFSESDNKQKIERVVDTGAGYLLKSDAKDKVDKKKERRFFQPKEFDEEQCDACTFPFRHSQLRESFDCLVCDGCYDRDAFPLITKTEACKEYLLTDKLIDQYGLKFELKKNPHHVDWGEMKLFLAKQVEETALKVWGSWEGLEKEKENRQVKSHQRKQKLFDKKLVKLRREATARKPLSRVEHVHDFKGDLEAH